MAQAAPWRNRVVGYGDEAPDQLLANPKNWRVHPKNQQDALAGVLSDVGIIGPMALVNRTTGFVVDGHLRVALAISQRQPTIPVAYVDLDEAEESEILATLDPIAAMAVADKEQLARLLDEVQSGDAGIQAMLADLAEQNGLIDLDGVNFKEYDETTADDVKYAECPACHHRFPQ